MTSRHPSKKRSQARVDRILAGAADILVESGDPTALTIANVAERSNFAVTTVYRYFADRDAILRALFEIETGDLDARLIERFLTLERVTLSGLLDVMMRSFFEYFESSPRAFALWFTGRQQADVLERVQARYAYMGEWFMTGVSATGMVTEDTPDFGGEAIVWIGDAVLGYIFREPRSDEQRSKIFDECLGMVEDHIARYSTELGRSGVPPVEFIERAGMFAPPGSGTAGSGTADAAD